VDSRPGRHAMAPRGSLHDVLPLWSSLSCALASRLRRPQGVRPFARSPLIGQGVRGRPRQLARRWTNCAPIARPSRAPSCEYSPGVSASVGVVLAAGLAARRGAPVGRFLSPELSRAAQRVERSWQSSTRGVSDGGRTRSYWTSAASASLRSHVVASRRARSVSAPRSAQLELAVRLRARCGHAAASTVCWLIGCTVVSVPLVGPPHVTAAHTSHWATRSENEMIRIRKV
jgi:hypothetical protein